VTAWKLLEAAATGGPFEAVTRGDRHYVAVRGGRLMLGPVGSAERATEIVRVLSEASEHLAELDS